MGDIIIDNILFVYKWENSITGLHTKHDSSSEIENAKHYNATLVVTTNKLLGPFAIFVTVMFMIMVNP